MSGRDMTRRVIDTICRSFDPVVVEMFYVHVKPLAHVSVDVLGGKTHSWFDSAVIQNSALEPWNQEVGTFPNSLCMRNTNESMLF